MSEIDPIAPEGLDEEESLVSGDSRRVGAMVGAAILGVIVIWLILNSAIVPNTVGMSSRRAREVLSDAGFRSEVTTEPARLRPANRVIAQTPSGGIRLRFWPVDVTVTGGAYRGGLVNREYDGLASSAYDQGTAEYTPTQVMPVDPAEVDPLYVPDVSQPNVMPDVLNQPSASALRALRAKGLRITTYKGGSTTDVKKDRIYYQKPQPGETIARGDSCIIWISTGPFDIISGKDTQVPYPRPEHPLP